MKGIVDRYARDLLLYAKEQNQLEDFYTNAMILTQRTDWESLSSIPDNLDTFLRLVPPADVKAVLFKFLEISGVHLGLLDVTVFSAVPITASQRADIEQKLTRIFDKHINMTAKVDPTLLGGLRIIAGHTVIDNTIKKKLFDLKKSIYKGVYFK